MGFPVRRRMAGQAGCVCDFAGMRWPRVRSRTGVRCARSSGISTTCWRRVIPGSCSRLKPGLSVRPRPAGTVRLGIGGCADVAATRRDPPLGRKETPLRCRAPPQDSRPAARIARARRAEADVACGGPIQAPGDRRWRPALRAGGRPGIHVHPQAGSPEDRICIRIRRPTSGSPCGWPLSSDWM